MGVIFHQRHDPGADPTAEAKTLTVAAQAICLMKVLCDLARQDGFSFDDAGPRVSPMITVFITSMMSLYMDGNVATEDLVATAGKLGYELDKLPSTEVIQ